MTKVTKSQGCKVRSLVNHFNQSFSNSVTNDDSQSIDGHMVKFKGRSSMKQYAKNKPIKWGITFWYRCASERGYLYQFELYLGKKSGTRWCVEKDWIPSKQSVYCFFDNFFDSPSFIVFGRGLYDIGTARKDRKWMPEISVDQKMKRLFRVLVFRQGSLL